VFRLDAKGELRYQPQPHVDGSLRTDRQIAGSARTLLVAFHGPRGNRRTPSSELTQHMVYNTGHCRAVDRSCEVSSETFVIQVDSSLQPAAPTRGSALGTVPSPSLPICFDGDVELRSHALLECGQLHADEMTSIPLGRSESAPCGRFTRGGCHKIFGGCRSSMCYVGPTDQRRMAADLQQRATSSAPRGVPPRACQGSSQS
jgi:hypothetical protein